MLEAQAIGAACLFGKIYIMTKDMDKISVYGVRAPSRLLKVITIPGLIATDILVSYSDFCLYLLDNGNGCVWRIKRDYAHEQLEIRFEPRSAVSMSLGLEGNLLITPSNSTVAVYDKLGEK